MKKNKYLHGVLPMVLINFPIGSVYCWTLFKEYVIDYTGFSKSITEWCFSLAIFFLGMAAVFGGKIVEKNVKNGALLTFIFFTFGWLITGIGIYIKSSWLTIIGFGPIQGIGLGLGYLTPIKTMMIWFEDRKGFAAGLSIASFGIAGVIGNPLVGYLLEFVKVYNVFCILAILYGILCFLGYILIHRPEYREETDSTDYSVKEIIFSKKFILLWSVFFINIACGLALISQEKQIYNMIGINSMTMIVLFCSINAISNVVGRLVAASIQDKVNKKHIPYYLMAIASAVVCFLSIFLPFWTFTTVALIFVIQFFFGCGFACLPNILHQNYGMKQLATIQGVMLSAWAVAGLVGNQISLFIIETYNLKALYLILGIIYAVELVILIIWAKYISNKEKTIK